MEQALFRIGGVYRNGLGRVVRVALCYDPRIDATKVGSVAVDHPDDMPQTFHPDLSTGRCELGNPNYSLVPGELHNFNGQWLPVEEKAEQPRAPYFAEAVEEPAEPVAAKSPIEQLRELVEVQGQDGNWNVDEYMVGMFNGMELALAVMEDRDPVYRTLKPVAPPVAQEATSHASLAGLTVLMERDHRFGLGR